MRPIQVRQLDHEQTPTAGLALVGHFRKTLSPAPADVDAALPIRTGVATSDIVRSDLGLLAQGNSDFGPIFGTGLVHGNQAVEERAMATGCEYVADGILAGMTGTHLVIRPHAAGLCMPVRSGEVMRTERGSRGCTSLLIREEMAPRGRVHRRAARGTRGCI